MFYKCHGITSISNAKDKQIDCYIRGYLKVFQCLAKQKDPEGTLRRMLWLRMCSKC